MDISYYADHLFRIVSSTFADTAVWWIPLALGIVLWLEWIEYSRYKTIVKKDWILLELRLPRIVNKSPHAMELVLQTMNQPFEGNWYEKAFLGTIRTWATLEIVSVGGKIHFFIRADRNMKNVLEAQLYAQYPDIEIIEAEDYVSELSYGPGSNTKFWGVELALTKPDVYPIKTYIDFGLDEAGDDAETKIDPLGPILESLSMLGPGEYGLIQIHIQTARKRRKKTGVFSYEEKDWKDEGKKVLEKLLQRDKDAEGVNVGALRLSPGEKDIVQALERALTKVGFDTGIRVIYTAKKDVYSKDHEKAMKSLFGHFGTQHLNGFKNGKKIDYDKPWDIFLEWKVESNKKEMLHAYKLRSYFYRPYPRKPFVLTTEELATIFHIPGMEVTAPAVARIDSKKGEPPANLPTGL